MYVVPAEWGLECPADGDSGGRGRPKLGANQHGFQSGLRSRSASSAAKWMDGFHCWHEDTDPSFGAPVSRDPYEALISRMTLFVVLVPVPAVMYGGLAFAGNVLCNFLGLDCWGGFQWDVEVALTGLGYAMPPMVLLLVILEVSGGQGY